MTPGRCLLVLLATVAVGGACEPPLTEARRSLAMAHAFRDATAGGSDAAETAPRACLRTRYLAPADSAMPSLLQTALRQRGVLLTDAAAPTDTATAVVAVSPVRELSDGLGLDLAVGRTSRSEAGLRTEWTGWSYRLRCGVAECEVRRRFGPHASSREAADPPSRPGAGGRPGRTDCTAGSVVPAPSGGPG